MTKLNPFSDKDKDEKKDKKDKKNDKNRTMSTDTDNNLMKSTRVVAKQRKTPTNNEADWTGFQERTSQKARPNSMTDKSILQLAEQKPRRQINVNQSIFAVMAAERDKLPDIEEKKSYNSSSDESSAIVVHTTDDAHDLTNLFMQHRGNINSDDDDDGLLKSSFIEQSNKNRNRVAGTLSDDLAIFEIVNSPEPKQLS